MNFKAYDILSSLVPGLIFLLALVKAFNIPYEKDLIICYTALAFLVGYLLNTFGSWLEDFLYFTWGGKPSTNLLNGKNIWKVKIYNSTELKSYLTQKTTNQNPSIDELFSIAKRYTNGQKDSRIEDLNTIYAFSRTLLTTVLISGIVLIVQNHSNWKYYAIIIPIIIITWIRCKQRGYYFSKEILDVYSKLNNI